jgi:hypothetical protein
MTKLCHNFQRFSAANPRPPVPEMQIWIESLEGEVARLNELLKSEMKRSMLGIRSCRGEKIRGEIQGGGPGSQRFLHPSDRQSD